MNAQLLSQISAVIRDATQRSFEISDTTPVGGGDINEAFRLEATDGTRYFLKLNDARHRAMFVAEAAGLAAISATNTIHVPHPIAHGIAENQSYLVLEHLVLNSRGDAGLLGEQLASLHRFTSDSLITTQRTEEVNGGHSRTASQFGFSGDNFIGTTSQANTWRDDWITFWREQRLGSQLHLAAKNGYGGELQRSGKSLLDAVPAFFKDYSPQPSLLHGDLWSGNHAFLPDGSPAIFDPAVYYGDRECDLAMTELFGGYPESFYAAYRSAWPLHSGYATRRDLYNLYHILNHANLFGGGYVRQAVQTMQRLLELI